MKNNGLWLYHTGPFNAVDNSQYILEGLIRTYPCDTVLRSLRYTFGFADCFDEFNQQEYNGIAYRECAHNGTEAIIIYVLLNEFDKQNRAIVESFMRARGWFKANEVINDCYRGIDMWCINYEKKFDDSLANLPEHLYHITQKRHLTKIKHYGLTPKESTWKLFDNESRVYFFTSRPSNKSLTRLVDEFSSGKRIKQDSRQPSVQEEYVLLTISTSKIDKYVFYKDPRMPGSVFTLECVPPSAIVNIELICHAHD